MSLHVMPRRRDQLLDDGGVDRGGVRDDLGRRDLQLVNARRKNRRAVAASRLPETSTSMTCPVLVDCPVHVAPDAVDLHVRLIHEPAITGCVASEPGRVSQQRREPLHPPKDRDVVDLNPAFDEKLLDVAVGQAVRRYHRTATTITSGGNRNPSNAELGGDHRRADLRDLTAQACLDHAIGQRNSAFAAVSPR
jgi:hypothetical protein